uniref:CWF19-like protein 2 n=1 Tax=Sinocyclocheilus rhinocerous TaxID=307959 RepID=A0A673G711_9TELE
RGEDTWMLPDVDLRLQQIGQVRGQTARDEWMTFDFLAMKTTSLAERRAQKEAEKEAERQKAESIEQAGLHRLELNPYWKDGGSGLPQEDTSSTAVKKAGVVNDGGVSWLRKSYQRMKEQADREQRSLESVVAERYGVNTHTHTHTHSSVNLFCFRWKQALMMCFDGPLFPLQSMEEFQKKLREAEEAAYGERREERGERWRRDHREEGRERWRKGDREERPRDRSPHAERERERDFERGSRGRDERPPRSRPDPDEDRHSQRHNTSSLSSLKFLKPSEPDEDMSGVAGFRKARPKGSTSNQSAGFRKPVDDDDGVVAAWRKSSAVQDPKETPIPPKHTEKSAAPLEESRTTTALVEKLKAQMQVARRAKENRAQRKAQNKPVSAATDSEKDVVLFRTDPLGRAWPVKAPSQPQEPRGGRRKRKAIETHQDGERVRYFKDDDGMDLQEMVRREKMSSAEDQNALYSRMAAKMMGRTDGDNYTLDDMFVSSAAQRERSGRDEERQRNKAVQETRRLAGQMEKCRHCFDSPELPKHLIAAVGNKVYLCLPNSVSLTEGHCLIVPIQHHTAATGLDEDIWSEIQMFRRALVRMFESQKLDCVFLETHMNPKRHLHMVYECVPLPRELGDMAPIYFKKAIMESDEEWAMNKKVVDLSSRDIRQAVPRGLPYFSVDFGLQGGFAHVIENEQKFPHYFGKEILGGMLDLEPRRWRKPIRENFDDQRKKVLKLAQWWKAFDCTKTDS